MSALLRRPPRLPPALPLLVLAAIAAAQAPPQPPVFRAEVTYVSVDVRVTDEKGEFVRGLSPEDFEVLEDGRARPIAALTVVDLPVERRPARSLGGGTPPPADVRSNAQPFDGRIYAMLLDETHIRAVNSERARRAASAFVEQRLSERDLMAVVHTAGARDAQQDLTSDKALLLAAISRTTGRALRSETAARIDEYNVVRRPISPDSPMNAPDQALRGRDAQIVDPDQALRTQQAFNSIASLRAVIDSLSGARGRRKAVLFVSEGVGYDFAGFDLTPAASVRNELRDAMAAAARANVVVYALDPRGLDTQVGEDITISRYPETDEPGLDRGSLEDEQRRAQGSLQTLSVDTGGFAVLNANDLSDAFERIVRENSNYYLLAYDAPEHKPDGKFHQIEVRVKRPGLQVHHRRGYASPQSRGKAPKKSSGNPRIQAALGSPLPVDGLGLTAFVAPFRAGSGKSWVLLGAEVPGRDLSLDGEGTLEITSVAVDSRGEVRGGATERAPLALRSETRARILQTSIRVLSRFELPPGRHQIRIAAHDEGSDRIGSVVLDLVIPDFDREPLSISGVAFASAEGLVVPTVRPDQKLVDALPITPVALREFTRTDRAEAYAEVYDIERAPHTLRLTTTVTRLEDGIVVRRNTSDYPSASLKDRKRGVTVALPLSDLHAGAYALRIVARSDRGDAQAEREARFTVVAARPGGPSAAR